MRNVVGVAAAVLFAVSLNIAILDASLVSRAAGWPMSIAAGLALVWLLLWLIGLATAGQPSRAGLANAIVASLFLFGIFSVLYAFVARERVSWDLTKEGRRDLAAQSVLVLQSLTEPVEVVCFFVKAGEDRVRIAQDKTRRFLEECARYTDQLEVTFVDPQEHPEQVEKYNVIGTKKSEVGSVLLKSGPRQREIPLSDVNARLEERDFTNALVNVTRQISPKIYFLMGHGGWDLQSEDPKNGGRKFAELLVRESYEIAAWAAEPDSAAVPADCDLLIVNGFTDDLRDYEADALGRYLDGGGRLLVLMNPLYKQETSIPSVERLRPFLEQKLGIALPTNVLVSSETGGYQIALLPDFSVFKGFVEPATSLDPFRGSYNAMHPITRGLDKQVVISLARSVEATETLPDGVAQQVLLRSTPGTWAETDIEAIMSQRPIQAEATETRGPNPLAVAITTQSDVSVPDESRPREARAVVVGNAYLSGNEFMVYAGIQDFLLNSVAWLTESEDLIAIRPVGELDEPLVLTERQQRLIAWVASLSVVQVIALVGVAVFLWRRQYR